MDPKSLLQDTNNTLPISRITWFLHREQKVPFMKKKGHRPWPGCYLPRLRTSIADAAASRTKQAVTEPCRNHLSCFLLFWGFIIQSPETMNVKQGIKSLKASKANPNNILWALALLT